MGRLALLARGPRYRGVEDGQFAPNRYRFRPTLLPAALAFDAQEP